MDDYQRICTSIQMTLEEKKSAEEDGLEDIGSCFPMTIGVLLYVLVNVLYVLMMDFEPAQMIGMRVVLDIYMLLLVKMKVISYMSTLFASICLNRILAVNPTNGHLMLFIFYAAIVAVAIGQARVEIERKPLFLELES